MSYKLWFAFLFVLFLSFANVSASSYNLEFNLVSNKVLVTHNIILDYTQPISIALPQDATSLSSTPQAELSGNTLNFNAKSVNVSYVMRSLLETSREGYYFLAKVPFSLDFDNATIKLVLGEDYRLSQENIFPKPSSIETDGSQIIIVWKLTNVSKNTDFPIFVSIKSKSSSIYNWIALLSALIAIVLIAYLVYDKYLKKDDEIEKYLLDSEKLILNKLKQANRWELWQKQLQLQTGFSKAKLSRIIRNLESRNLIEKIPFGNTNKIRLK